MEINTPFGSPVQEVSLTKPPLIRVVAQVRFPRIMAIDVDEKPLAAFQERIRDRFPVLRAEKTTALMISPEGIVPAEPQRVWKFEQLPQMWSVALTSEFVSVSAPTHDSHNEFLDLITFVLDALDEALAPRVSERIGIRYVDRVADSPTLKKLPKMLRAEILGSSNVPIGAKGVARRHSFTDNLYTLPDKAQLHARWGFLPPDATFDPSVEPVNTDSWVLDLDHFVEEDRAWDSELLLEESRLACERIYRFFRWAVGDDFLVAHGGAP